MFFVLISLVRDSTGFHTENFNEQIKFLHTSSTKRILVTGAVFRKSTLQRNKKNGALHGERGRDRVIRVALVYKVGDYRWCDSVLKFRRVTKRKEFQLN